jgi:hypothetical protein
MIHFTSLLERAFGCGAARGVMPIVVVRTVLGHVVVVGPVPNGTRSLPRGSKRRKPLSFLCCRNLFSVSFELAKGYVTPYSMEITGNLRDIPKGHI